MREQGGLAVSLAALSVALALLPAPLRAGDRSVDLPRGDREALRRLLEDLVYEPAPGDVSPLEGAALAPTVRVDEAALREARWRVALDLRGAIAAMTSQDLTDYLAGRATAPEVVDLWVWLPEPRVDAPAPAAEEDELADAARDVPPPLHASLPRDAPPPTSLPASAGTPSVLGDAAADGLRPDSWGPEPAAPYRPVRIVPEVAHGDDGHTRSVWLRDPAAQARRFLEHQAQNAALGGRDWLRRDDDARRAPLPPRRDARGHTISRYAGGAPSPEEEDAILRGWGEETLERLEREQAGAAPRAPRPLPSVWETLRSAFTGGRD